MPTKDNLYISASARTKLMQGIYKVAEAVGSTMGTGGSNAIIEAIENPGHLMTNDGYTIANSIVLADPIEDMGRKILVEAINRANKASGDGSSTTCILTAAIIEKGITYLGKESPMSIKQSLEECVPFIEASINKQTRQLYGENGDLDFTALEQVATVSSEDPKIGERIAEIYTKIGKTGIIHWDISKTAEDTYTIGQGITVEGAGWYSPYMCDAMESGQSTNQIRIKNPQILITRQKIASAADLNDIAASLNVKNIKDLVVFCDEIEPLVIPDIVKTRALRGFRIAIVKVPTLWKDWWFTDLAVATGAKIADPLAGLPISSLNFNDLGTASNIVITKEDTYIDGIKDVSAYIKDLEEDGTDESKLRASRLNTKTARYYVGAQSDSALSHRRLKVEDAISAAWQALNGGVVAGGGSALFSVSLELPQDTVGRQILNDAFMAPAIQIMKNSGLDLHTARNNLSTFSLSSESPNLGYDSRTGEIVDMFAAGIIDPANVVLNAVRNAISVAAAIITATTVVTLPRVETQNIPQPSLVSR